MAFVNGGAVVSCGNVDASTSGSMLLGSSAGGGTANLGPVSIFANLVEPVVVKTARAISSTRIRIDFSNAVLNNAALADPRNYAVMAINGAVPVAIQSVDVPNSLQALSVDLIVSEMTNAGVTANYLLSVNSESISLGPELVVDGNMEAVGNTAWLNAYNAGSLTKVAGSPSGAGTQAGRLGGVGTGFRGVFQSGLMQAGAFYRVSAWLRSINGDGKPFIAYGSPASSGDCLVYGSVAITYSFSQVDFLTPATANSDRIMIGRDTALAASVQAEADELSLRRWVGTGGGAVEVTDAFGVVVVSDLVSFLGVGVAPKVLVAYATDKNTVVVQFMEPILDLGSIRTVGAYTANLGLTISAVLAVGLDTVTLKTSDQTPGQLYTLTLTGTWYDLAMNAMTSPATTPVLGFVTAAATKALLTLKMYNFLIMGLRDADQTDEGARFIERFVAGPQAIWDAIVKTIFDIPKIWSASDCPDELLQFLKRIVGWTPDTDAITESLDFATLRRLIAASVRFWKTRGPEASVEDLLQLTTAARSYVLNWFALRFILDEVYLGEEHGIGTDPWLLSTPGEGSPDAWTYNVRIVDNGSLDRQLVREIAKLTRPVGERVLITYLGFLDRFETAGDETQWAFNLAPEITRTVAGGMMKFAHGPGALDEVRTYVIAENNQDWSSYMASWTMDSTIDAFYLAFYVNGDTTDPSNIVDYYFLEIHLSSYSISPNRIILRKSVNDVRTTLVNVQTVTSYNEPIAPGVKYTFRVEVTPRTPGAVENSIKVWWDDLLVIEHTIDTAFTQGSLGILLFPQGGAAREFNLYETEMLFLPAETDFIDLGNDVAGEDDLRGEEMLSDPEFNAPADWEVSTLVTVAGGYVDVDPDTNGRIVRQIVPFFAGVPYEVKFTISNLAAGPVRARFTTFDGQIFDSADVSANGDYSMTVIPTSDGGATGKVGLRFGSTTNCRIERISCKQIIWAPE